MQFVFLGISGALVALSIRAGTAKGIASLGGIDIDDPRIRELIEKDPEKLERLIDHEQAKLDRKSRESLISNDIAKMLKDRKLLAIWINAYIDPDTRIWKHYVEKYIVDNKARSAFSPMEREKAGGVVDTQRRRQRLPERSARDVRKKPEFTVEQRRLWQPLDFALVERLDRQVSREELPEKVAEAFGITVDDALDLIRLYRQRQP